MAYALDVNFLNPFIDGAIETLKVQCSIEAKPGKPFRKGSQKSDVSVDIAGVIGITSDTFKGSIAIGFPAKTFLGIMGSMLGETYTEITKDVEDGAGELLNIIFGAAKRVLNAKGYTIQKALPSVVRGQGIEIHQLTSAPTIVIPFDTPVGLFQIEIGIEPVEAQAQA